MEAEQSINLNAEDSSEVCKTFIKCIIEASDNLNNHDEIIFFKEIAKCDYRNIFENSLHFLE